MGKIRLLPKEIVSKIAAGEVVERPVFAIKELIDNSLDAGADHIKVEIEQAGLKKIKVADNGEGMDEEDLKKCFLPHATSKLFSDNLIGIKTLGFRGEALASIASVSNLKLLSRTKGSTLGGYVEIFGGELVKFQKSGAPMGTTITVNNLFSNVPARKKFLKSLRTEYRHILDLISYFALSYPEVRFECYHNKKLIFDLAKKQDVLERIKLLLGPTISENLIPFKHEDSYLKLKGFLAKPQISSQTSSKQQIFINNRKVTDTLISQAVKEAYGNLLEQASFPVFILFLEIPYELIDINIHPRKEQISFVDNQFIYQAVKDGVSKTLAENNLTFGNLSFKGLDFLTKSFAGKLLKDEVLRGVGEIGEVRDILQVHNLYLLCQTKTGIALLDQHAAHERVLFEKFKQAFKKHQKIRITLTEAKLLQLSLAECEALLENFQVFLDLGFKIYEFGENTFKVEEVPLLFQDRKIDTLIKEILEDLISLGKTKDLDLQTEKMLQYLACRAAYKAGDKLIDEQIKDLMKDLSKLDLNYTCPHGRPVRIEIPLYQIDKLFQRG